MEKSGDIACVVLAAGRSTRMGAVNKLTTQVGGKAMVRCVVEAALASRARPVLVVTGHEAHAVQATLAGLDAALVANPDYAVGLSSSLKAGIAAVPPSSPGAIVLLGDMPQIAGAHVDLLIAAFAGDTRAPIVVPVHRGKRGNPVLWPRRFFPEMLTLEGDAGARRLMSTHADAVLEVDANTDAIFTDIDTPDDLAGVRRG